MRELRVVKELVESRLNQVAEIEAFFGTGE